MSKELAQFDQEMGVLEDETYNQLWDFNDVLQSTEEIMKEEMEKEKRDVDITKEELSKKMQYIKRTLIIEDQRMHGVRIRFPKYMIYNYKKDERTELTKAQDNIMFAIETNNCASLIDLGVLN